ncbi:hypothetical protein NDR87_30965 [Nocardia sp. CDC159]|uniref:Uncharacterized protein n=1 Tax=Nocardia pulmonis TaxID=2951408 RepID=A0A9X2J023_9NOCA|nr:MULTISPECIES: hypothetical protein [Nocardia]MCM6778028.1 hypothetical protein [Nocardia pulmonis]MCM6790801.1 hypothetical protein [Nocardia sp. CDC159]
MPYPDIAALIEDAEARDAQAARDSENLAMLVDRSDFDLNFDYVTGTSDPDDPEIARERALRKKHGIKPPPLPILAPVAQRDPKVTAELIERYRAAQKPYEIPSEKPTSKLDLLTRSRRDAGR